MRKKLSFIAILLILALILAIKTSGGYYPFSRLTEEQLMSVEIELSDGTKKSLTDSSSLEALVSSLNRLRLSGRSSASTEPMAVITLHTLNGEDFVLTLYENRASLDGDCYRADAVICRELFADIHELF